MQESRVSAERTNLPNESHPPKEVRYATPANPARSTLLGNSRLVVAVSVREKRKQ